MKAENFSWGRVGVAAICLALLFGGKAIMKSAFPDSTGGTRTEKLQRDAQKCATCFRRAKSMKQLEKCERMMYNYMEKWAEKGARTYEIGEFQMEAMKGMDDTDWANLR